MFAKESDNLPHPPRGQSVMLEPRNSICRPFTAIERGNWKIGVHPLVGGFEELLLVRRKTSVVSQDSCLSDYASERSVVLAIAPDHEPNEH